MEYLIEIKNRFSLVIINYLSTFFICYYYKEVLLFLIIKSCTSCKDFYFIFTSITEVFSVYLDVIFFVSFQILIFYIVYSFFIFLIPSLFIFEYKYLKFLFYFLSFIIVCFISVSVKIFIPLTWDFFVSFQTLTMGQSFYFEPKLLEYLNFYVSTYYFCALFGQVFLFGFVFFNGLFLKTKMIKEYRKLCYYFFIIFGTMISPPDVYSQIFISLILILFYELVVLFFMVNSFFSIIEISKATS